MTDLNEFADEYIENEITKELVESREKIQVHTVYNPYTFEPSETKINNFMAEIGERIRTALSDLEPTKMMIADERAYVGIFNPPTSKRNIGEPYRSKIRIIIEKLPEDEYDR